MKFAFLLFCLQVGLPLDEQGSWQHVEGIEVELADLDGLEAAKRPPELCVQAHLCQKGNQQQQQRVCVPSVGTNSSSFVSFQGIKKVKSTSFAGYTAEEIEDAGKGDLRVLSEMLGDKQVWKDHFLNND